jgi:hypothetical protein
MSIIKVFGITVVALFALIGVMGVIKKNRHPKEIISEQVVIQSEENAESIPAFVKETITYEAMPIVPLEQEKPVRKETVVETIASNLNETTDEVNRIEWFFSKGKDKFPFIETVSYKSRVSWLQGRPAWIADYASYYGTSRHFIARSLNGNRDYYTQKVSSGDLFNVFQKDKEIKFYLLVDLSKLKMWFYVYDASSNLRYLVKTYKVGCGKLDKEASSGCLTPIGTFTLGEKVAIYKPGVEGFFKDEKVEMIRVFGTRWIPYAGEQDETQALSKGLGMHGIPWAQDEMTGELIENKTSIGCYDSSGCVRLLQEDIEELFSIVITKPTTVQIVKQFQDAKLPGVEWVDTTLVSAP